MEVCISSSRLPAADFAKLESDGGTESRPGPACGAAVEVLDTVSVSVLDESVLPFSVRRPTVSGATNRLSRVNERLNCMYPP